MPDSSNPPGDIKAALEAVERRWIESALALSRGNQRQAAALLGIAEPTLRYRMSRLGLAPRRAMALDESMDPASLRYFSKPSPQKAAPKTRK